MAAWASARRRAPTAMETFTVRRGLRRLRLGGTSLTPHPSCSHSRTHARAHTLAHARSRTHAHARTLGHTDSRAHALVYTLAR
eukprot:6206185-Pleurochrysis_carterae.AAC.2